MNAFINLLAEKYHTVTYYASVFKNGQPYRVGFMNKLRKMQGPYLEYYENGFLHKRGFKNSQGKFEGKYEEYNVDGLLCVSGSFDAEGYFEGTKIIRKRNFIQKSFVNKEGHNEGVIYREVNGVISYAHGNGKGPEKPLSKKGDHAALTPFEAEDRFLTHYAFFNSFLNDDFSMPMDQSPHLKIPAAKVKYNAHQHDHLYYMNLEDKFANRLVPPPQQDIHRRYYSNGNLFKEGFWNHDVENFEGAFKEFYAHGPLYKKGTRKSTGAFTGLFEKFLGNGQLAEKGMIAKANRYKGLVIRYKNGTYTHTVADGKGCEKPLGQGMTLSNTQEPLWPAEKLVLNPFMSI